MDEPLSNLDAKLRVGMRASLAQLHQRLGVTTVYVTHDQVEAMTLGQRVAVMKDGRHPAGRHAAEALRAAARPLRRRLHRIAGDESRGRADRRRRGRLRRVPRSRSTPVRRPSAAGRVVLGMRPETFEDAAFASPELPTIDVEVVVLEDLGADAHVFFRVRCDAGRDRGHRGRGGERCGPRHGSRRAPERASRSPDVGPRRRLACGWQSTRPASTSSTPSSGALAR